MDARSIEHLLHAAAIEMQARAGSASSVGVQPDELEQLADRLVLVAMTAADDAAVSRSLQPLADMFGEHRDAWRAISPSFVEVMDRLQ